MKFAYYKRLGPRQRRIYDRSDEVSSVRLPSAADLAPAVDQIVRGLDRDDRTSTEIAVQRLVDAILRRLHVSPVSVRVLAVRPSNHRQELHGLYEFGGRRTRPVITVWMRTAQRRQVVAFRSFLRTLLHEVVHHLDYQLLRLEDSFHTQGFYKRAESLYRQLTSHLSSLVESTADPQLADSSDTPRTASRAPARVRSPRAPRSRSLEGRGAPVKPATIPDLMNRVPARPRPTVPANGRQTAAGSSQAEPSPRRPKGRKTAVTEDPQFLLPFMP